MGAVNRHKNVQLKMAVHDYEGGYKNRGFGCSFAAKS